MKNKNIIIKNNLIYIKIEDNIFFTSKLALNLIDNINFIKKFIDNKFLFDYPISIEKIFKKSYNSFQILELGTNYLYEHKTINSKNKIYKDFLVKYIGFISSNEDNLFQEKEVIISKNKDLFIVSKKNLLISKITEIISFFPDIIKVDLDKVESFNISDLENIIKDFIKNDYLNKEENISKLESFLNPEYILIIPKEGDDFDSKIHFGEDIKIQGKKCGLVHKTLQIGMKDKNGQVIKKAIVEVTL